MKNVMNRNLLNLIEKSKIKQGIKPYIDLYKVIMCLLS